MTTSVPPITKHNGPYPVTEFIDDNTETKEKWWKPVADFLKDISEFKDIVMMQQSLHAILEAIKKTYEYNNRLYVMTNEFKTFLNNHYDEMGKDNNIKNKKIKKVENITGFPQVMEYTDITIQNKINELYRIYFKNFPPNKLPPKTIINIKFPEYDSFHEDWVKWRRIDKSSSLAKERMTRELMGYIVEHVKKQIQEIIKEVYCGNDMLGCSFKKLKSEIYYKYGRIENFDKHIQLVIKKIKDSDPTKLENLHIHLNHLNQIFSFLNIDMIIEDIIRNNRPVATKKSELFVANSKVLTNKQDIFLNRGNIVNPTDGKNYNNIPETSHHNVYQTFGKYKHKDLFQQSHGIEKIFQSLIDTTQGINTDSKQIFLSKDYKFRNKDLLLKN